jgi:hypothetical protein
MMGRAVVKMGSPKSGKESSTWVPSRQWEKRVAEGRKEETMINSRRWGRREAGEVTWVRRNPACTRCFPFLQLALYLVFLVVHRLSL